MLARWRQYVRIRYVETPFHHQFGPSWIGYYRNPAGTSVLDATETKAGQTEKATLQEGRDRRGPLYVSSSVRKTVLRGLRRHFLAGRGPNDLFKRHGDR